MDAGQTADDRIVAYCNMPGKASRIGHDQVAAQPAIVCHVNIGHQKIFVANRRDAAAWHGPPIDGHILSQDIIISYHDLGRLTFIA